MVAVPRPVRRAGLRLVKNYVLRTAVRLVLTFMARSERARFHFFSDAALEEAMCAIVIPQRMKLRSVSLASLFPGAESLGINVDVLPEGE